MILCFYLKEVYTFKEKHKIIDVPNSPKLSRKISCRASSYRFNLMNVSVET
jgi:hypothetical protein